MRHGDARDAPIDARRPLSEEGVREAERAGELLALLKEAPGAILHSDLLRSRVTAEIVAGKLGMSQNLRLQSGLRPEDSAVDFADDLAVASWEGCVMLVGHMPFLEECASCLLSGSENTVSIRFSTGTLLCLERRRAETWTLRFHFPAKMITKII